jgi:ubiquinone/menaquinone biosynthesis C-methylase UbiE
MTTMEIPRMREAWDRIAPGYDHFVTPSGGWALPEEALRVAGLKTGMRFLDVASGSGALSLPAARLGAQVLAVDLSPAMIERLNARARDEGLSGLEGRVMDGHALDLDDDTFDMAGSQFGVMLFPDLRRGLREMVRVTRPGGTVLMVAYGPPRGVEFLGFFIRAMRTVVPGFTGPPMDPPPLPFQVAEPEALRGRMAEAGLNEIRVEPANERLEFESGSRMWDWVTNSNPIAAGMIADLTKDQRARVQQELDRILEERAEVQGASVLDNNVHIAIGIK